MASIAYNDVCYVNTYSPTGYGYTYRQATTAGGNIYCSGVTASTASNLNNTYPTPDKCLSAGYCWQPVYGSQLSNVNVFNFANIGWLNYAAPNQIMGCFAGSSAGTIAPSVTYSAPVSSGTPFYLADTKGNVLSAGSNNNLVLGPAGSPLILQFNPSANPWTGQSGTWTTLYSPLYNKYLDSTSTGYTLSLGSLDSSPSNAWTTLVASGSTSGQYYLLSSKGCYLTWDYQNNVGACANSLSTATLWTFNSAINVISSWKSVGCYLNSSSRTFTSAFTSSSTLTAQQCITFCLNKGYTVAAMEVGQECYCSNTLNNAQYAQNQGDCSWTCSGDSSSSPYKCGAGWRLSVYTANPNLNKWTSWGCYVDNANRILNQLEISGGSTMASTSYYNVGNSLTIEYCINACALNGYSYAGLEVGTQCCKYFGK